MFKSPARNSFLGVVLFASALVQSSPAPAPANKASAAAAATAAGDAASPPSDRSRAPPEPARTATPAANARGPDQKAAPAAENAVWNVPPGSSLAENTVKYLVSVAPQMPQVRVVSHQQFLPDSGPAELLVYSKFPEKTDKVSNEEKIAYHIVVIDAKSANSIAQSGVKQNFDAAPSAAFAQAVEPAQIWAEAATVGPQGTDFKQKESPSIAKTLIRVDTDIQADQPGNPFAATIWRKARVYVIGCDGAGIPKFFGSFETTVSASTWCRLIAIMLCVAFYIAAAVATFFIHQSQRIVKTVDPKGADNQPMTGTNYAGWMRHFDPVVLSAGSNGRGSATKLQILFFSILVFGVVSYIWMLTGHLTGLSNNVLLLMGISGLGATASAGTELAKNRLSMENWAWLINRHWLPKGGVAEVNLAQWKDIVTTDGEFDVYRFQMITFSFLVGAAILGAGTQLTDLSSFEIPAALLGILGLSQAVYVVGKLVAPPAISDLNSQIEKLKSAEKALRDTLDSSTAALLQEAHVRWHDDDKLIAARLAFSDYLEAWAATRTIFESTLGRLVPKSAEEFRPPYRVPNQILAPDGQLRTAVVNQPYSIALAASGGTAPYTWAVDPRALPEWLNLAADGTLTGTPSVPGNLSFTVTVTDAGGSIRIKDFILPVSPAPAPSEDQRFRPARRP